MIQFEFRPAPMAWACAFALNALLVPALSASEPPDAPPVVDSPAPASVGTAQPAPDIATTLSTVEVIGASFDARRDDTATRIVVPREQLQAFGDSSLAEALKRLPGVTVTPGAAGRSGSVSLRGLGRGYTQLLVNGQKMPAGFDLDTLSPDQVERVEILRTATADMRAEAIAGTINIVLRQSARKDGAELTLGLGSMRGQLTPNISARIDRRDEHRSFSLATQAQRRDFLVRELTSEVGSTRSGAQTYHYRGQLRANGSREAVSVSPTWQMTLENGETLNALASLETANFGNVVDIGWQTLAGPSLQHARYVQATTFDLVQWRTELGWTHPTENGGSFNSKLLHDGNREHGRFSEQGYTAEGQQNLDDRVRSTISVNQWQSTGKLSLPALDAHRFETGWEAAQETRRDTREERRRFDTDAADVPPYLELEARIRRVALYAQDEWTLRPRWSLYLGLRWELIETRSEGNDFAAIHHRASVFSPILQSVWKLAESRQDQVRVGISRTYRTPPIRQLIPRPYTTTNNRALNPDEIGNPALRPELATGIDLAYERYWGDQASLSVGGYARRIEGVIRQQTRLQDGRWVSTPVNGGDAIAWGLEMDGRAPLRQWWPQAAAMELRFNLARHFSRVNDVPGNNNRLAEQPTLSATLGVDWKISERWTLGTSANHRSDDDWRISEWQNAGRSARTELDAYLLRTFAGGARLRLSVSDLLAQDQVNRNGYTDAEGDRQSERRRLMSPIVRAQLEVKF